VRIAVIGSGAIGCTLGALLARSGQDITLIGRAEQVAVIHRHGLRVDGCLGDFTVPVAAAEVLAFRPDLALLTVKNQDVTTAVRNNLPSLENVPVVLCQNGIRSHDLVSPLLPPRMILSAVIFANAVYDTPGKVTLAYSGSLIVGRPFGCLDHQAHAVAQVLRQAITTQESHNIRGAQWLKLIVNLNNALSAMTNLNMSQVYANPYLGRLGVQIMREGLRLIKRGAIPLEPLPEVSLNRMQLLRFLPVGLVARAIAVEANRLTPWPVLVSTLQSIRRGRPSEIEYLNGEIVKLGQDLGLSAPLNTTAVELVHEVERTGRFFSVQEVRRAMQQAALGMDRTLP
jgi:2-dehydropantoate 2-reductase